jgi:DNA-binding CsgD family transcriptional regulator
MLVGREAEQRTLDGLLDRARDEHSGVLVLRGAPGIGKTALLDYAQEQAAGMKVLRCVGIEAEHELPFAGMHALVRPCLDLVDRLPAPQAAALKGALGLSAGGVEDRFLVSLGLLSLLAEVGEEGAVLCCIDDAQWLDGPSAEALLFAARRLEAEPIAMVMTVREGEVRRFDAAGVPQLELETLTDRDAEELLTHRLERRAAPEVIASLLQTAAGNPLALLELPLGLSSTQLEGAEPILGPPPVRPAVEESFRARVSALPERTRRLLLVAAADELGDLPAIRAAAARLGLDGSDLAEAERDGLLRVDGSVTFRHPLVRSAVYRSATRDERQAAHEALAAAVDDQARSAWHRALVTDRPDEGVAAELEAAAAQAATRGAQATASAAFERAAELSEQPARRGHRLACAARASLDAGRPDAALALVERARSYVDDPLDAVELDMIRATDAGRRGSPSEAQALIQGAARTVAPVAPEPAAEMLAWSVVTALVSKRIEPAVGEGLRVLDGMDTSGPQGRFARALIEGAAAVLAGDVEAAGARLSEAFELGEGFTEGRMQVLNTFVGAFLGDYPGARRVSERGVALARAEGSLASMAGVFPLLVLCQLGEGRIAAAIASTAEGLELAERLGFENDRTGLLALEARVAAQQGREEECRARAEEAMQRSLATGLTWAAEQAHLAFAELELGLGNAREALEHLEQLDPLPLPPVRLLASGDIIDAALRVGDEARAQRALAELEAWAPITEAPLVQGLLARCRAVLEQDDGEARRLFEEALMHHAHDAPVFERARTQLAYGERLRRERHKVEARTQLRNALDTFEGLGTKLWSKRARGELQATGETARKRDVSTLDELTPQELRIAQLVAAGATNRDAAAQLYVSPKTVEYHLRKVFLKLGVNSRVELARVPLGEPVEGPN